MRILKTCFSKSWGGLEIYSLTTILKLRERGLNTALFSLEDAPITKEAKEHRINTITIDNAGYLNPAAIKKTISLLKKENFDIIHCATSKDLWLITPALKLTGLNTPLLMTKHMGSYIVKKDLLHRFIYKRLDYALAISNVIAKNLVDTTPLRPDKIKLLHNGIDTKFFDPGKYEKNKVRSEFDIKDDELLIGMTARFSPGKGHEEFIAAANMLCKEYDNLKFIIVGKASRGEDDYENKIKDTARQSGIGDKIIFTGFRKDIPDILAAIDIFVFPSHAEAFGIALIEAFSMAKPNVCSASDGVLDIALDETTSLLFKKQSADDLAAKLKRLIEDGNLRERLGANARRRALEHFDIEIFSDKLIAIYKEALNRK
ncbi:glycosyltransferase family 4 protein [Melioribacter sp. Ez-97]|uniref:glycosyltransferase family 4 protein n=1 Tax=Melioribacter sp. Ez-97 TaxID=3423434 RepID=UPI003EDA4266